MTTGIHHIIQKNISETLGETPFVESCDRIIKGSYKNNLALSVRKSSKNTEHFADRMASQRVSFTSMGNTWVIFEPTLSLSKSSWNSFRRRCFSILWRVCIWSSKKKPDAFLFFTLINQKEIKMELDFYSSNEDLTILNADLEDISASGCCCCCCCAGSSW